MLFLVCVLAFVLRTTNAATIFVGGAVIFPENDPYYHMRRVFLILEGFPRVPYFDAWLDHPHGAPVIFPPLFDLGIAALARLAGLDAGDRFAVERLAAFVPPLLGAVTCVPLFWLARLVTGSTRAALLAALLLALLPAHVWYSRLGFVDHHVAVTLLEVTLLALVLRALQGSARGEPLGRNRVFAALATACLAAGMLAWNGWLLVVAVLDVFLAALFLARRGTARAAVARLGAVLHLGAALLAVPTTIEVVRASGRPLSSLTLSWLQVGMLVAAGAGAALAARATSRSWSPRRIAAVVASAGVVLALGALLERGAIAEGARWVLGADPFMASVQEVVPILRGATGGLDPAGAQIWMSRFFLVVPLLLAWLAWRTLAAGEVEAGRLLLLVWSSALFVLTLRQRRFGEMLAPAQALLVAEGLWALGSRLRARLEGRGVAPRAAGAVLGGALVVAIGFALWPYYRGFLDDPGRLAAIARPPALASAGGPPAGPSATAATVEDSVDVRLHRALSRLGAIVHGAGPIAARTGAVAVPAGREDDIGPGSARGVMSPWPLGHKILYLARLPVVATPFGSHLGGTSFTDWADFFLETDEARALELLRERRSGFVAVDEDLGTIGAAIVARGENPRDWYAKKVHADGRTTYTLHAPLVRTLYFRTLRLAGSEAAIELPGGRAEVLPALDHLRLLLDAERDGEPGHPKVYEVVAGAELEVATVPGATVTLRYAWRSPAGREREHRKTVVADARGVARAVLPYSSERPDLGQTSRWIVATDDETRAVHVAETAVRDGGSVRVALGRS